MEDDSSDSLPLNINVSATSNTTMADLLISFGIEALTICSKKNQTEKHCNFCMMTSSFVSPLPASNWVLGDYIGMESCFDFYSNEQPCGESHGRRERPCTTRVKRELPPPIRSLSRSVNGTSHMPKMFRRYHTEDGRLILIKEKREYLRAHRSNGRLTLHLVPVGE
ncbi:hypothetical protein V6N13_108642 [Hibiscus sabdariffa]|uniref:FAF domain-containing protein n=1 Tax=Hibiscus sabdariffa TaxID=183260 RepID=A0ABR2SST1_9ROSI